MEKGKISKFNTVSPSAFRYAVDDLITPYLGEEAFVGYKSKAESALAAVLEDREIAPPGSAEKISKAAEQVTANEVYEEEGRTRHDIIAQVNMIRSRLDDDTKRFVHMTATSYDTIETANAMRYIDAFRNVIIPDMLALEDALINIAKAEKDTLQVGRTHLQHAEPVTFGFATALFVKRFGDRILKIKEAVDGLEGKFSGAVGTYAAADLFVDDPEKFEEEILSLGGVKPAQISTQIAPQEPLSDLIYYVISGMGVVANWANNMYLLQQPEIGEVGQPRGKDISRSSTMPNKANPVGVENILSMWKHTKPAIMTVMDDMTSLHQRDLTNSASQRFIPEIFNNFDYSIRRATRIANALKTNPNNMLRNFDLSAGYIIAEPLQLLLSSYGYPNAHARIGELADKAKELGVKLMELVEKDEELKPYLERFTQKQLERIYDPSKYIGIAPQKAEKVANFWEEKLKELRRNG